MPKSGVCFRDVATLKRNLGEMEKCKPNREVSLREVLALETLKRFIRYKVNTVERRLF